MSDDETNYLVMKENLKARAYSISPRVGQQRMLVKFARLSHRVLREHKLEPKAFRVTALWGSGVFDIDKIVDVEIERRSAVDRLGALTDG